MKTLFPYLGGKARQAKWIAGHIDSTPHKAYVETCCGAAAVFFAKQRSKIEILNDRDVRFQLLFKAIRNHLDNVVDFCSKIEYSKTAFDESYHHLRGNPDGLPDWKLGSWVLFQVSASFAGWPDGHSFACRIQGQNPATAWAEKISGLAAYSERLQTATMMRYDAIELIRCCDRPGVLMYVDPPYVGAEFRYKAAKGFDHQALAAALRGLRHARAILSHYDIAPYRSLFADWRSEHRQSTQSCKGATIHSPTEAKPVVETLWFNY